MNIKYAAAIALSILAAVPALSMAHGGEVKPKQDMKGMDQAHKHEGTGHAAALGRPAELSQATRTMEIVMGDNMRFEPKRIDIKQGETIRFVVRNDGKVKHEMVLGSMAELKKHAALMLKFPDMEHDDPNAVSVEPGKTGEFAWAFTKTGTFDFACLIPGHFEAGMKGRIKVSK